MTGRAVDSRSVDHERIMDAVGSIELFDRLPIALSVLDLQGRLVAANLAFRRQFALGDGALDQADAPEFAEEADRVRTARALVELGQGRRNEVRFEQCYIRTDGTRLCARLTATRLLDDLGVPIGLLGVIEDVSEQQAQKISSDHAHRRLQAMLANISDTVTLVDVDGAVLDTTGLHARVMGYDPDFWQHLSIFDLVDPLDLPRLLETRDVVLRSPGEQVSTDLRVLQADGAWADIELTAVNLLDDPSVGGIVLTSRNITARKQIEAELAARRDEAIEQSRLRSELVARVSHELRNQLHALGGLTELINSSEVPRSVRQLVESAHRQAEQFENLVDDLLEYSRMDADRKEPVPSLSWVRQIVADAVSMGSELARREVELLGRTDEEVPDVVLVDGRRVRQVVANLVSNAAKFTYHGRIEVHVARCELDRRPGLRVTVTDTGIGIAADDLERIFHPFDRGSSADRASGAGLGLAISERVVHSLDGQISVTSEPGVGSAFTVEIPIEETDEVPEAPAGTTARLRSRSHVLVVEDNPVNQMLVAEQLHRLGVRSTVVGSGHEALATLATEHDIDCVLMDWQLPGLDGVEATRRHRSAEGPDEHLPIIGMTASARPTDRRTCLAAGMDEMLVKPVGLLELGHALHPFIGERRSADRALQTPVRGSAPAADTAALDALADQLGSVAPVRSIVTTFLTELDHREVALRQAVEHDDEPLLRRTAHTLRSTSRTLGANDLDALSQRLEHGEFPPSDEVIEQFDDAVEQTRTALRSWIDTHQQPA